MPHTELLSRWSSSSQTHPDWQMPQSELQLSCDSGQSENKNPAIPVKIQNILYKKNSLNYIEYVFYRGVGQKCQETFLAISTLNSHKSKIWVINEKKSWVSSFNNSSSPTLYIVVLSIHYYWSACMYHVAYRYGTLLFHISL